MKQLIVLCAVIVFAGVGNAAIENFNGTEVDIKTWVGSGENESLLVIDYNDGTDDCYFIIGYCWDGDVTVRDMLDAIESAGVGLSEADGGWNGTGGESTVYGLCYDADGDGGSFVETAVGDETGYATDSDDYYEEGWNTGCWSQWASTDGASWTSAWGVDSTSLADGDWAGFSWDPEFSFSDTPTIPEPCTMALISFGGLLLRRRRSN